MSRSHLLDIHDEGTAISVEMESQLITLSIELKLIGKKLLRVEAEVC